MLTMKSCGHSATRVAASVAILSNVLGIAACRPQPAPPHKTTIAITQIVTHPGIDAVRTGFEQEMGKLGYREGDNLQYDRSNANGDFPTAQAICRKLAGSPPDLLFSISTPSSQACAEAFKGGKTPIVFG